MYKSKRIMKKGNIMDVPESILIILTVIIGLFIMFTILTHFNTTIQANNITNVTEATGFLTTFNGRFLSGWDFGVLFAALLFPVFSFFAARKIPVEMNYVVITMLLLGFILLMGMIGANLFGAMLENALFSTFVESTTFIKFIAPNLFWYSCIYTFIVVLGLFGKPEGSI